VPTSAPSPDTLAQQQHREAVVAVLQQLMARWPQIFSASPAEVRPLARGIDKELVAQLSGCSRRQVGFALAW
jgi:hypothetical protein